MTSREALKHIVKQDYNEIICTYPSQRAYDGLTINDMVKIIEKDLEMLEIIKRYSFIQNNYKEGYGTFKQFLCNIHTIGMKEDFEKVKEWLEK